MIAYLENLLAGFSHLLNAILGGDARYSLSARVGALAAQRVEWALWAEACINLALFSRDHCREHAREEGLI